MEDQVVTNTPAAEPTIVESTATDTNVATNVEAPAVVDQATPMDANVTYNNVPEIELQSNMTATQNVINTAVQTEHYINQETNAGKAMNKFLTQDYDYDKNEAGTYWVAGAINDNNTQMSFLETLINEEMYDEMDLQKYYYDTNLATARAYAAQKKKEVAYGFYRAAQERAFAEGELTGWYMPAEGRYMLGQYTVAQNTLENPDATEEDKAKANRVVKTTESWFAANQISSRGIKCLGMMNYEENVRYNKAMGKLQEQANAIAMQGAKLAQESAKLQLRELKFQLEEYELQSGHNITKEIGLDTEDTLGHNLEDYKGFSNLKGYSSVQDMLQHDPESYAAVLTAKGKTWVDNALGDKAQETYKRYYNDQSLAGFKTSISEEGGITAKSAGFTSTHKKTGDGKEVLYTVVGNEVVVGYFEDGVWMPITDENATFSDDKSIKTYIENNFGKDSMNTKGINSITIDGETYSFGRGETADRKISVTNMRNHGWTKYDANNHSNKNLSIIEENMSKSETVEGVKDKDGKVVRNLEYVPYKYDTEYFNEFTIMKGTDENGEEKYYSFNSAGELKEVNKNKLADVPSARELKVGDDGTGMNFKESTYGKIVKSSWVVGYNKDKNITYMALPRGDGSVEYYALEGNQTAGYKNGTPNVASNNVSEKEIQNAGFNTLTKPDTTVSKETKYNSSTTPEKIKPEDIKTSGSVSSDVSGGSTVDVKDQETKKVTYNKKEVTMEDKPIVLDDLQKERNKEKNKNINDVQLI